MATSNLAFYTGNRSLAFSSRSSKDLLTLSTFNFTRSIVSIRICSCFFCVCCFLFCFRFFQASFTGILSPDFPWTTIERKIMGLFKIIYSINFLKITKIPLGLKTEILRTGFCDYKKNRYHQQEQLCSRFMSCLVT